MDSHIETDDARLAVHFAEPHGRVPRAAVVVCHGFPTGPRGATASASTFPELADRIAADIGCLAVAFNFRGTGASTGEFSIDAWLGDLEVVTGAAAARAAAGVWLVGVAEGGTLAVCAAVRNAQVQGVVTLGAPLRVGAREPARLVELARRSGMLRGSGAGRPLAWWTREFARADALVAAGRLAPRRLLVLHGSDDEVVRVRDARALAEAAGPSGELRLVPAASHELRHDPRAVAGLIGWLDRQMP